MYIAFAVSELVGKISFGDWNLNPMGFFSSLFYFYNYALMFHPHPILPRGFDVIWSLCVEEHFYLMFPLMYLTMLRSRISRETQGRILLALCVVGLCWRTYVSYHGFPESGPTSRPTADSIPSCGAACLPCGPTRFTTLPRRC